MLSTLLLSFACAAPAQEPVAPLVDSFPANSLITVELSLEPWDRLRKQTSAHVLFHDRNLLKKAIAVTSPLGDADATNEMRAALGSARFVFALTPESLALGGLLLAVEPVNFGAAAFDWAAHLQKFTGVPVQKVGNGFITLLHEPASFDVESASAYLSGLAKSAATGEGTLGMHAGWKSLHRVHLTRDDLLRVTLPGWNWNEELMMPIAKMIQSEQAGIVSSVLAMTADLMGLKHGLSFKSSIRGSEIIDSYYLPRPEGAATVLASIGNANDAFARFDALAVGDGAALLSGVDLSRAVDLFQTALDSFLGQLGMAIDDEPVAVQAFQALRACAAQLGPEALSLSSLESLQDAQMGVMRIAVRDREALEAAWQSMPEEITALMPMLAAQSGGEVPSAKLDGAWLDLSSVKMPEGAKALSASSEYRAIRDRAKQYVGEGEEVLWISFAPASFSEQVWSGANLALEAWGDEFGFAYSLGPIRPEDRKAIGPVWGVLKRTARGIEGENHSSFGNQLFGSLAAIKAVLDAQNPGVIEELDEDEF
jgi:hypothetical protein